MMRAAVLYDQAFVVEDRSMPIPGPGEVLLKTRLCGICGSDLHLFKHAAEIAKLGVEMGAPPQDMTKGLILGHEYIAEVAGFGPDTAQALSIGDRVVSVPFLIRHGAPMPIGAHVDVSGAYAQYFLGTEMLLLKVPDGVPDAAAALVEPLAIAVHAVSKSPLNGDSHAVVIQGCGPIGLAVAAVLRMRGVASVCGVDFSPRRRGLATAMGATRTVDPREASAFADLPAGKPLLVFDCTGAKGVLARTIRDAPAGTHVVVAGIAPGEETISPTIAIAKEMLIQFVIYYTPEEFGEALQAVADGKLNWQPLVTATIGLSGIAAAFEELADPERHAKVMIDPWLT
jgi:threonine dehydrogenase-like Zn-dependent dehydrogenase